MKECDKEDPMTLAAIDEFGTCTCDSCIQQRIAFVRGAMWQRTQPLPAPDLRIHHGARSGGKKVVDGV